MKFLLVCDDNCGSSIWIGGVIVHGCNMTVVLDDDDINWVKACTNIQAGNYIIKEERIDDEE